MTLFEMLQNHKEEVHIALGNLAERDMENPFFRHIEDKERELRVRTNNYMEFFSYIMNLTPYINKDRVIFSILDYDDDKLITSISDGTPDIRIYCKEDLKSYEPLFADMSDQIENLSDEDIDTILHTHTPTSLAYDFSPWEKWLGLDVDVYGWEAMGVVPTMEALFSEMTFNGVDPESHKERLKEFEDSSRESEELMALPEEEQSKHFASDDKVFEDSRWVDVEEEKALDRKKASASVAYWIFFDKVIAQWKKNSY